MSARVLDLRPKLRARAAEQPTPRRWFDRTLGDALFLAAAAVTVLYQRDRPRP